MLEAASSGVAKSTSGFLERSDETLTAFISLPVLNEPQFDFKESNIDSAETFALQPERINAIALEIVKIVSAFFKMFLMNRV